MSFGDSTVITLDSGTINLLEKLLQAAETVTKVNSIHEHRGNPVRVREALISAANANINLVSKGDSFGEIDSDSAISEVIDDTLFRLKLIGKWANFAVAANTIFKNEVSGLRKAAYVAFGIWLPEIYERHIARPFGVSRSAGILGGPGVRFAMTAADEIGIRMANGKPYASDVILDARRLVKHRERT
jgi:hypothetical protein